MKYELLDARSEQAHALSAENPQDLWSGIPRAVRKEILDRLLTLQIVKFTCRFYENPHIVDHAGNPTEELRAQWYDDNFRDLPEGLSAYLSLAYDERTFSLETLNKSIKTEGLLEIS